MLKIMGSILVFAAAAGMAGTYKRELADHLALLYALRKLLVDLSCYGNGTRQPVEVLLGCFVRTPDERLNEICRKIADCLIEKNEKNGEQVWKRVFEEYRKKLCLTGEESVLIGEAGGALFGAAKGRALLLCAHLSLLTLGTVPTSILNQRRIPNLWQKN